MSISPVFGDGVSPPIRWTVSGTVKRLLEWSPGVCWFGEHLVHFHQAAPVLLRVAAHRPLASLAATCSPELGSAETRRVSATEFLVSIRANKDLPVGPFRFRVSLQPTLAVGGAAAPSVVQALGIINPEVSVFPKEVHLGSGRIGQILRGDADVVSNVGQSFVLDSVSAAATTSVRVGVRSGSRVRLRIEQDVTYPGNQRTTVAIWARAGARRVGIVLPITYYGLARR